jgi:cardiolipin synthase
MFAPNHEGSTWLGIAGVVMFYALGFAHMLHALMHARTSQGAIAWVVSFFTIPFIAIPLYWLLGRTKFSGYVRARRGNDAELRSLASEMFERLRDYAVDLPEEDVFERAAEELGGLPFTRGNEVELLIDGKATFERIFAEIAAATESICVNFFIVKNDKIGARFQQAIIEKARVGVKVYFLFDEIGSHKISGKFLSELKAAGVECECFGINRHWWSRLQLNFRNHRKIIVVDSQIAFLGGFNIGDEYLGRNQKFGDWRDTHLMIKGPAVEAVQLVFLEDWFWACSRVPQLAWEQVALPSNQVAAIIPTGPADPVESWKLLVAEAANTAKERLWITSPYFVPDDGVLTALQLAALRGVDVRILLPDHPDHLLVWLSAYTYYEEIIPYGVRLFRYHRGFLHQKVMLIDDRMATVGTANLDNRSFRLNFEITAFLSDSISIRQVREMLSLDMAESSEVKLEEFTKKPFLFRAACRAARLMAPLQ